MLRRNLVVSFGGDRGQISFARFVPLSFYPLARPSVLGVWHQLHVRTDSREKREEGVSRLAAVEWRRKAPLPLRPKGEQQRRERRESCLYRGMRWWGKEKKALFPHLLLSSLPI